MDSRNDPTVKHISDCFVKPESLPEESKKPYYLSIWDLAMVSVQYIQKGLLYKKPPASDGQEFSIDGFLEDLKRTLSLTLVHFFPLAGRLKTDKQENPPSSLVYVDCTDSPGARFIYATVDMTISDVLSPVYVPIVVQSFFDHDRALNYDGHTLSLLSIQVTELVDGIFIGCSMNHAIGDGTSYWHFLNTWSEIFQAQGDGTTISRPPVLNRWFPDGVGPIVRLPFSKEEELLSRYEAPPLKERMFHFSSETIAKIKARANSESKANKISSFQSLTALVWRSITKARGLAPDVIVNCKMAINNRSRLDPPLSPNYVGNSIQTVKAVAKVEDLLRNDLGWSAWMLHQAVVNHGSEAIRSFLKEWVQSPFTYRISQLFDPLCVMMGSSPRFNKYGNEFGLGKPIALRSGYAHKFDGKVSAYPGSEGGGSVELEICLTPAFMDALESDQEFMDCVS